MRRFEAALDWAPVTAVPVRAPGMLIDAEITAAAAQPNLVGHRVAQVPEYVVTLAADWRASADTRVSTSLRACGRRFETTRPSAADLGLHDRAAFRRWRGPDAHGLRRSA